MIHRLLHGHKPIWGQAPISDYLAIRVCLVCHPKHAPIEWPKHEHEHEHVPTNFIQVLPGYEPDA